MFTGKFWFKHLLKPEDEGKGSAGEIKLPTMADLMKPAGQPPTEAPPAKPPGEKAGDPPQSNAPPETKPEEDASLIPISVTDPEVKAKSPEQFAAERKGKKEAKQELETRAADAERRAAEAERQLAEFIREKEQWTTKEKDFTTKLESFRGETEATTKKLEEAEKAYTRSFSPKADPWQDEEFTNSHKSFITTLSENLPLRLNGPAGEFRVMFNNIMQDPNNGQRVGQIMEFYANATTRGDQTMIDRAVNLMAGVLGADIRIQGDGNDRVLPTTDPAFVKIEEAMQKAVPHYVKRSERALHVTREAPRIATEMLAKKTTTLKENLAKGVLMPLESSQALLTSNPTDSRGLLGALAHHSPVVKELAQAAINDFGPSMALVKEGLDLPLLDPSREGQQAHQGSLERHRAKLAEVMQYAIVGRAAGPVIANLIRERDAAEARANAAAKNTNPGAGTAGGEGGKPDNSKDVSSIPLATIPDGM